MAADAVGIPLDAAGAGPGRRPRSLYVGMADGCRLAVDVYLPPGAPRRVPAILIFTL